jgi:excisionase family DNA binding protein
MSTRPVSRPHQLLSPREVARELRVDDHRVYAMLKNREIAYVVTGERRKRIPRSAIADWIKRSTVHPLTPS